MIHRGGRSVFPTVRASSVARFFSMIGLMTTCLARHGFGAEAVPYALMPDSVVSDECLLCGRPTIPEATAGSFNLRLTGQTPIDSTYAIVKNDVIVRKVSPWLTKFGLPDLGHAKRDDEHRSPHHVRQQ